MLISECLVFLVAAGGWRGEKKGRREKENKKRGSVGEMNFFKLLYRTPGKHFGGEFWLAPLLTALSWLPVFPAVPARPCTLRAGPAEPLSHCGRAGPLCGASPRRGNAPPGNGEVAWSRERHGDNLEGGEEEEEEGRNHMEQEGGRQHGTSERESTGKPDGRPGPGRWGRRGQPPRGLAGSGGLSEEASARPCCPPSGLHFLSISPTLSRALPFIPRLPSRRIYF